MLHRIVGRDSQVSDRQHSSVSTSGSGLPTRTYQPVGDEVADSFDVSRVPVREAFRSLAAEGWIEIRPRRETLVAAQTERELRELMHVRKILGAEVAGLAAVNRTDTHLERFESLIEENEQLIRANDVPGLARNNEDFHVAVAAASCNLVLEALVRHIEKRNRWYFGTFLVTGDTATTDEHIALASAIRRRERDTASSIARAHVVHWEQSVDVIGIGFTIACSDGRRDERIPGAPEAQTGID